jgi:hypothetical protein
VSEQAVTGQAESADEAATDVLAGYVTAMEAVPLLGYLVLYSVFDGSVTPWDLELWFEELGLNKDLLPARLRADGAFEVATSNTKTSYPLPSRTPAGEPAGRRRSAERTATLMIRPVRRDDDAIVCHLVREVRDSGRTRLAYTDQVAVITFARDRRPGAAPGAGTLNVTHHMDSIPQREHETVLLLLGTLREQFERNCRFLTGDKIRGMLRAYIESLMAIRVRPTGGVYFVHSQQAPVLESLRVLIGRFGAGSSLYRVPLPDQDEMREMVIEAWRSEQRAALQKLSVEIAEVQAAVKGGTVRAATVQRLYEKFRQLQEQAGEHGRQLGADLDEMGAAMDLAGTQVVALLTQVG